MSYQGSGEQADPLQFVRPVDTSQPDGVRTGKRLRVLILGTCGEDRSFHTILATNIRQWGYEAALLASEEISGSQGEQRMEGDILVYDMDTFLPPVVVWKGVEEELLFPAHVARVARRNNWIQVRLVIVLSSRSVSRRSLERVGAVALLHKPFDMRYLRIFQKLLAVEGEERRDSVSGVQGCLAREWRERADQALFASRILIADDCKEVTRIMHQCLVEQGDRRYHYEVREAHDGLELLEQCLTWRPHCVVTDLLVPWLNGYQVMRCLADCALQPMPAFVVISALVQHEIPVDRSYLRGQIVRYISKPFELENLLTVIEQTLYRDRASFQDEDGC